MEVKFLKRFWVSGDDVWFLEITFLAVSDLQDTQHEIAYNKQQ